MHCFDCVGQTENNVSQKLLSDKNADEIKLHWFILKYLQEIQFAFVAILGLICVWFSIINMSEDFKVFTLGSCRSAGCSNKAPQTGWLINNRKLLLTVPEAGTWGHGPRMVECWLYSSSGLKIVFCMWEEPEFRGTEGECYRWNDCVPQNSYVKTLPHNGIRWWGPREVIGVRWGHEGGALVSGVLRVFLRELSSSALLFPKQGYSEKAAVLHPEEGSRQDSMVPAPWS